MAIGPIDTAKRQFRAGFEFSEGALTLTGSAEAADVIAVAVSGASPSTQYIATVYDAAMLQGLVGAWTLAETGAGAEISTTAKPSLLFSTSSTGAAEVSVTDVAGASGLTVYLEVRPAPDLGALPGRGAALVEMTFD